MKKLLLLIAIIPLIAMSCKKDPKPEAGHFTITHEDIALMTTSVTITVTYSYPGNLEYINCLLSQHEDMSAATVAHVATNENPIEIRFINLEPNRQYYYQYEYSTGLSVGTTEIRSFATNDYNVPTVTTAEVTNITTNSAVCGGNVTNDGGLAVTARGVCWSTSHNPTLNDNHTNDGQGVGVFTSQITMTGFDTCFIRAYATNSNGTSYGEEKTCMAFNPPSGLFSVSDTKRVYIASGNLQYQASTNTWRFAEHPWDYVGGSTNNNEYGNVSENGNWCYNNLIDSHYTGWIDLFGWSTSGYNHGGVCYQPWSTYEESQCYVSNYSAYGNGAMGLYDMTGQADWGYNRISNGGNEENRWRTLTIDEWNYLIERDSKQLRTVATVNGVRGLVLLPDDWNESYYSLYISRFLDNSYSEYDKNIISNANWIDKLESHGAVFLPAAGARLGTRFIYYYDFFGKYWASSPGFGGSYGDAIHFGNRCPTSEIESKYRCCGFSVRLVRDEE